MTRTALVALLAAGCAAPPTLPYQQRLVIRGYLYAYQPVSDVEITSTVPLTSSDTVGTPISDATVTLTTRGVTYTLTPTAAAAGYYHYAGTDLTVAIGDTFDLAVTVGSEAATARTIVPASPTGLTISSTQFVIDTTRSMPSASIVIRWSNGAKNDYFTVVNSAAQDPRSIPGLPSGGGTTTSSAFTSAPTQGDSAVIGISEVHYLGLQRVRLYRVPPEYAALYASREQDSRDLNEPATNVHGGLGIFSAFTSDSVFFTVIGD
ncbi:MAG TPA: DUF4249 family protein [Gemmatimonadaceae bacterium]|nr:DUF4249 family protein [Gemmatimonadaceae bacterium]